MLEHVTRVEAAAKTLAEPGLIAFAAACCERQLPVYARVAAGAEWDRSGTMREILDYVWNWLRNEQVGPPDYDLDAALPSEELEGFDAATNIASMFDLLRKLPADYDAQAVGWIAENALNLLDALLYEVLDLEVDSEGDKVVWSHELMLREIDRQERDLATIQDGLTEKDRVQLRQQSVGESIFGQLWYP